ncbi:MAG: PorP/SprF family type IX secretion system membrane protein [Chryseolinea sp.]
MKFLLIISALLLLSAFRMTHAQSPVFSQYYSSTLYLNPALSGLEKDIYMGMNYRTQWSSIGLPFNTFQFSFIKPILKPGTRVKHLGGLGATFLNDVAGPNKEFKTQGIMLSGAYNFHLTRYGNNIVSVGLQAGAMQQRVNYSTLQWSSQYSQGTGYDGSLNGESGLNSQVFNPILNAGVVWSYTSKGRLSHRSISVFNGLGVSNIIRPRSFTGKSNEPSLMLYKFHGGFSSLYNRKYEISPNYLVQYQNQQFQVNMGAYISYYFQPPNVTNSMSTKVMFGAWYRLQDSFIVSAGFSNRSWNLGFSYDSNVSSLGRSFGYANAYELSLAYKIVVNKGFKRFSSPLI